MPNIFLLLLFIVACLVELLFVVYALFALASVIRGAPYVPTTDERLRNAIKLIAIKPGMRVADLGSGDGKVLVALARLGCIAHGFEINPLLVFLSRLRIRKAGLGDKATVFYKSFWSQDLSSYDLVFVYGITYIMKELSKKLRRELKPGSMVLSIIFPIPNWECEDTYGKIYLYQKE